jgi:hypothetical protein
MKEEVLEVFAIFAHKHVRIVVVRYGRCDEQDAR